MVVVALSIFVTAAVYILAFPPIWMSTWASSLRKWVGGGTGEQGPSEDDKCAEDMTRHGNEIAKTTTTTTRITINSEKEDETRNGQLEEDAAKRLLKEDGKATMVPPPSLNIQPPNTREAEGETTPKAKPARPSETIPTFSLSEETGSTPSSLSSSSSMPPPQLPKSTLSPSPNRNPTLPQFPAANSAQRARGPVPNRGPPGPPLSAGLAPPPTITSKPSKPSRKVLLEPGCSPLDWARVSSSPADLRNLPASTPYLRVTPSMLKKQNGRKGQDAWMALNAKVYNIAPYAKFHPGGVGELLRAAGKDGTRLFGEIHPWVNYETMLQACLIGLLVDESEGVHAKMDQMD